MHILPNRELQKGDKQLFSTTHGLGLVLAWTWTRGSIFVIQLLFGGTYSCSHVWLWFFRRILLSILQKNPAAKICDFASEEILECKAAISANYLLLQHVWRSMDGLKVANETMFSLSLYLPHLPIRILLGIPD